MAYKEISIEEELKRAREKVEMKEWREKNRKATREVERILKRNRRLKL